MQPDKRSRSHRLNMSIYSLRPSRVSTFLQDKRCKQVSFQYQYWRRNQRGKVQSLRSMQFLLGSIGLRDRVSMQRSAQCPLQSTFQERRVQILRQ